MASKNDDIKELVRDLHSLGAIKFGSFQLKSGITSPVYIDLRVIISKPSTVKLVSKLMWDLVKHLYKDTFTLICGVPYTGLPIASCLSLSENVPMVMKRKEAKAYGTKKMVEGIFEPGQSCLVVEDIVTSGASVIETAESLTEVGLKTAEVVVLIDRQQGGVNRLRSHYNINVHPVLTIESVMTILGEDNALSQDVIDSVFQFLKENQIEEKDEEEKPLTLKTAPATRQPGSSFEERVKRSENAMFIRLLQTVTRKKSNLCLSADVKTFPDLLNVAKIAGPYICLLKTHADTVEGFDAAAGVALQAVAKQFDFLIFEDRKFADIGSTAVAQFEGGIHRIAQWADVVNAHAIAGAAVVEALGSISKKMVSEEKAAHGLLLVAEMSCKGAYTGRPENAASSTPSPYANFVAEVAIASGGPKTVMGFIAQSNLSETVVKGSEDYLYMTPGVKLVSDDEKRGDGMGQQYRSPQDAVCDPLEIFTILILLSNLTQSVSLLQVLTGSDIIIVGRGILHHDAGIEEAAKLYRDAAWQAYQERIGV